MATRCPKCHTENIDSARFCSNCVEPLQSFEKIIPHIKTLLTPTKELSEGTTFAGRYEII